MPILLLGFLDRIEKAFKDTSLNRFAGILFILAEKTLVIAIYKKLSFIIGIGLVIGFIYFVGPHSILEELLNSDLRVLFIVLLVVIAGITIKTLRWGIINQSLNINLSFSRLLFIVAYSQLVNMTLPSRAGEPLRVYYLYNDQKNQKRKKQAFLSVLVDNYIDIIYILGAAFLGLIGFIIILKEVQYQFYAMIFASGVIIVFMASVILFSDRIFLFFYSMISRFASLIRKKEVFNPKVLQSEGSFIGKRVLTYSMLVTLFIWIFGLLRVKLIFLSLGSDLGMYNLFIIVSVGIFLGLLALIPGNYGTKEAVWLSVLYGSVPKETIIGAALLDRVISLIGVGIVYIFMYGQQKLSS